MQVFLAPLFFVELALLFLISRKTIQYLFYVLHELTSNTTVIYLTIALVFLPGTILHELSHFLMAIVLLLRVREIHIFPEWKNGYLKLGKVLYEKRDVIRSILVGVAPICVGLLFFWWMSSVGILTSHNLSMQIVSIYLIFVISSTMFSSKQDLVDVIYILPIGIVIGIIYYFFPIDLSFISKQQIVIEAIQKFLYDVTIYLGISLLIHSILLTILFSLFRLIKK